MTDRERLMELIDSCRYWGSNTSDEIADHLLAHGVIVLPCKVGETVWIENHRFPAEITEIYIDKDGLNFVWAEYDKGYDLVELWDDGEFLLEDIGKTVFLTREEAEAALKEGK